MSKSIPSMNHLDHQQIRSIRLALSAGVPVRALAIKYGVPESTILQATQ